MRRPRIDEDVKKKHGLWRFPKRTLLLMILAVIAFARLWCVTHTAEQKPRPADVQIER
jgi:hypothetical protein